MSLILYTKTTEPKQTTPFGEFLMYLRDAHGAVGESNAGSIQWTRFPVATTVSAGLWLVMFSVSEKLGRKLTTMQEVSSLSAMINRMIEAGMLIRYGSTLDAAVAFGGHVIDPLHRAIALGYRPGMLVEQEGWQALLAGDDAGFRATMTQSGDASLATFVQTPSGMFFADLFRAARMTGEQLGKEAGRVNATDTLNPTLVFQVFGTNGGDIPGFGSVTIAHQLSEMLSIYQPELTQFQRVTGEKGPTELRAVDWQTPLRTVNTLFDNVRRIQVIQSALQQLPVQLNNLPESVSALMHSIAGAWLNTQIFLAAGGYPLTREHILFSEISKATEEISKHTPEIIENVFWMRMERRSRGIRARIKPVLTDIIRARIVSLRNFQNPGSSQSPPILCEYDSGGGIDATTALEMIASGTTPNEVPDYDKKVLLPSISWKTLTERDVAHIVLPKTAAGVTEGAFTAIDNIIPYFKKLKPDVQRYAIAHTLEHYGKEAINTLLAEKLTSLTPDLLVTFVRDLEPGHIVEALPSLLRDLTDLKTEKDARFIEALIIAIADVGEAVRPILSQLELREHVAVVFYGLRFEVGIMPAVLPKTLKQFRAAVGEELFWPYFMSTEVLNREQSVLQEGGLVFVSWVNDGVEGAHAGIATERELRKQFRDHSEADIFLWLHEASPTRVEDLASFQSTFAERMKKQKAADRKQRRQKKPKG